MCKVSVIIPVYNTAPYLREALNSVINQTLEDIEIICVDDGSTDESLAILNGFADRDERIFVVQQKNQGQSVARNVAMQYAHGEYIYFMDSDDVLLPNAINDCYLYCNQLGCDFCFFDGDIILEDGAVELSWDYHRTKQFTQDICYNGLELINTMLETFTHRAVPWLLFIRREYILKTELSFYPGIIHEDELFTVKLYAMAERVGCLKKSFVLHRVRNDSTMGRRYSLRNIVCYLTVVRELHSWAQGNIHYIKLVRKFSKYTLDAVFRTAFILSFSNKCKAYFLLIRCGYVHYVTLCTQLKFWIKK